MDEATDFVRDPIYDRIQYDSLERGIIDTPIFQRLRWVRQNDVAFLVYPSLNTTRFEHSLGVMHLAGRIARKALTSSLKADRGVAAGESAVKTLLSQLGCRLGMENMPTVTETSSEQEQEAQEKWLGEAKRRTVRLARLAGLLHDVGHLPLSHLMEHALSDKLTEVYDEEKALEFGGIDRSDKGKIAKLGKIKLHELALAAVLEDEKSDISRAFKDGDDKAMLKALRLLFGTKQVDQGKYPELKALKEIVDAEVDADRMDACARDGRALGDEFGHFDLERIVESFRVGWHVSRVDTSRQIKIRPREQALSAIEALLVERYKVHKWMHYFHTVCAFKAITSYVVRTLFAWQGGPLESGLDEEERKELDYKRLHVELYCNKEGATLDDGWLFGWFERALAILEEKKKSKEGLAWEGERLRLMLRTVLHRESCFQELWELPSQYAALNETAHTEWSERLEDPAKKMTWAQVLGEHGDRIGNVLVENRLGGEKVGIAQNYLERAAKGGGELFIMYTPRFKAFEEYTLLVRKGDEWEWDTVERVTALAGALKRAWAQSMLLCVIRIRAQDEEEAPKGKRERAKWVEENRPKWQRSFIEKCRGWLVEEDGG